MRIGVEEDGTLELVYGGAGELVRAKVRLEVREVVDRALAMRCRDHERRVRADFARHFRVGSTPLRQPRWNRSGFRPTDRVFVGVLQFSVMQGELAYHVEEGCVGEEGSSTSTVYARMDASVLRFFFGIHYRAVHLRVQGTDGTPRSTS